MITLDKKEALEILRMNVHQHRHNGRIRSIRLSFEQYYEIINTPLWKRVLKRVFAQ